MTRGNGDQRYTGLTPTISLQNNTASNPIHPNRSIDTQNFHLSQPHSSLARNFSPFKARKLTREGSLHSTGGPPSVINCTAPQGSRWRREEPAQTNSLHKPGFSRLPCPWFIILSLAFTSEVHHPKSVSYMVVIWILSSCVQRIFYAKCNRI